MELSPIKTLFFTLSMKFAVLQANSLYPLKVKIVLLTLNNSIILTFHRIIVFY